jgi:hypothetical protein
MSLRGCPDVANIVRTGLISEVVGSTSLSLPCVLEARRMYVGFVSQEKDANEEAGPNMARGRACCGRIDPEGSDSPGRM